MYCHENLFITLERHRCIIISFYVSNTCVLIKKIYDLVKIDNMAFVWTHSKDEELIVFFLFFVPFSFVSIYILHKVLLDISEIALPLQNPWWNERPIVYYFKVSQNLCDVNISFDITNKIIVIYGEDPSRHSQNVRKVRKKWWVVVLMV